MDRLFLDANVLFSAAYRTDARRRALWGLKDVKLLTSSYALEEARRNLDGPEQREELEKLVRKMAVLVASPPGCPVTIDLPQKDRPIVLAAIETKADYLITGDFTHFGKYYGRRVDGVLILTPSEYLQRKRKKK